MLKQKNQPKYPPRKTEEHRLTQRVLKKRPHHHCTENALRQGLVPVGAIINNLFLGRTCTESIIYIALYILLKERIFFCIPHMHKVLLKPTRGM